MKTTAEKIEVMQAWLDGKTIESYDEDIEHKDTYNIKSHYCSEPKWNWLKYDYNVIKEIKQGWFLHWPDNSVSGPYPSEESAISNRCRTGKAIMHTWQE